MVEETLEFIFKGVESSVDVSEFGSNGGRGDWYLLDEEEQCWMWPTAALRRTGF
jgi:hypothetical protein